MTKEQALEKAAQKRARKNARRLLHADWTLGGRLLQRFLRTRKGPKADEAHRALYDWFVNSTRLSAAVDPEAPPADQPAPAQGQPSGPEGK